MESESETTAVESVKVTAVKEGIGWLAKRPPEFIVLLTCMFVGFGAVLWFGVTQFPQHIRMLMAEIQSINDKNNEANKTRDVRHAETIKALREAFTDGLKEYRDQCRTEHDRLERLLQNRKVDADVPDDGNKKNPVAVSK